MVSEAAKPYALQAIIFFMICRNEGLSSLEAWRKFDQSYLANCFQDMTVGNLWGLMTVAGYYQ